MVSIQQIDYAQVERSIGFHGAPMQKVWEGERGDADLARANVKPDFAVYHNRQKHFAFQDRTKRLKLHQLLARKATILYRKATKFDQRQRQLALEAEESAAATSSSSSSSQGFVAVTQPFNRFLVEKTDKSSQLQHIYSLLNVGDIVYALVQNQSPNGLFAKLLCTREPNFYFLADLNAKAFLPNAEMVTPENRKGYAINDYVVCEILELTPDNEKMSIGMRGIHRNPQTDGQITLGQTTVDQLPVRFKSLKYANRQPYNTALESAAEFQNPYCLEHLYAKLGLSADEFYTNMSGLRGRFPSEEYSTELRQSQASKWAFRSVAEGIEHFKEGRHSEAFQCLNNALSIDPRNVEGLVARGALYANSGSFKKAVGDFETALKLNASHANARKYMGETLVALGRSYEDENNVEEAKNAYQACLNIIPTHEEAKNSLEFLWSKASSKNLIDTNELTLPALNLKIGDQKRGDKKDSRSSKKIKKKKSKGRKRDSSSSSSYSSDSSDSSSGSNSSNDSSSSSDSDYSKSKKKRRSAAGRSDRFAKPKSLSPLSKRMASMASESNVAANSRPIMPTTFSYDQSFNYNQPDDYELKVRKFLELTREEDNYEEKVRQFVEEANRHRKDRRGGGSEEKSLSKKKDKRKSRKSKKESKKRRKEKRGKSSRKDKDDGDLENMEFREAMKIFKSLPGLDMSEKLQSVEKSLALHSQETKNLEDNKWKMIFAKQSSKPPSVTATSSAGIPLAPSTSKFIPKQYAFTNDDDDSDQDVRIVDTDRSRDKASPVRRKSPIAQVTRVVKEAVPPKPAPLRPFQKTAIGPVVMDKFGSFRLATNDPTNIIPKAALATTAAVPTTSGAPVELASTQRTKESRSRSRSRRRYSSASRSRSRSLKRSGSRNYRRRNSRSKSYNRSQSRSRSGSYSRSRSRSNSNDRRRRANRGSGNGTYYKPRFNNNGNNNFRGNNFNNRGGGGGSGGFRGGYRDNYQQNSVNYRGFNNRGYNNNYNNNNNRGGRWVNRGGNASGNQNNRYRNYDNDYRGRRIDRDSRSRSFDDEDRRRSSSIERSPRQAGGGAPRGNSLRRSLSRGATTPSNSAEGAASAANATRATSLERIEAFIDKEKKKEKEEMLDRNADIKKKFHGESDDIF